MQIKFFDFEQAFGFLDVSSADYPTRINAYAWKVYTNEGIAWKGDAPPELPFNGVVSTPSIDLPVPLKSFEVDIQRNGRFYFARFFLESRMGFEKDCFQNLENILREKYGEKWVDLGDKNQGHILNDHGIPDYFISTSPDKNSNVLGLFMGTAG